MCGGRCTLARLAVADGVSPVRVSTRISSPISSIGVRRLRCTSTASAFQRRDVERVQTVRWHRDQIGERRQEPGKRLARARRRDQQRVIALARASASMSRWCRRSRHARVLRTIARVSGGGRSVTKADGNRNWHQGAYRHDDQARRLDPFRIHTASMSRRPTRGSIRLIPSRACPCHARPCRSRARRTCGGVGDPRHACDHGCALRGAERAMPWITAKRSRMGEVDVTYVPGRPCAGLCADRARLSAASGSSSRAITSAAPIPTCARIRARANATSSSPRRRSACRFFAIPKRMTKWTNCSPRLRANPGSLRTRWRLRAGQGAARHSRGARS